MPIPTITGPTFSFEGDYTPPTWSGIHTYNFGVGFPHTRQVWADNNYVFAACEEGLNIIDIASELQYSFITYSGGFTTVWANEDKVFLGTQTSGVKYIDKTCISGSVLIPFELTCLLDYAAEPRLRSNNVRYIHGHNDIIVCCTASGVQSLGPYGYAAETETTDAYKCFVVSTAMLYYTLSGSAWSVNRANTRVSWMTPDATYTAASGLKINDLFVNNNTVFMATSSGIQIVDETTLDENFYGAENFIAIWTSANATVSGGKIYISTPDNFSVVDLSSSSVLDYYTPTHTGIRTRSLQSNDVVDLYIQGA